MTLKHITQRTDVMIKNIYIKKIGMTKTLKKEKYTIQDQKLI